jgi:hypothetical protein
MQLYKAVRDSFAAEHGARMTAMHKATDNATGIKRSLEIDLQQSSTSGNYQRDFRNSWRCRSTEQLGASQMTKRCGSTEQLGASQMTKRCGSTEQLGASQMTERCGSTEQLGASQMQRGAEALNN